MTVRIHRDLPRLHGCTCGANCIDLGILEEHVVSAGTDEHWPASEAHTTHRCIEAREQAQRRARTREAIARAAGVSVEELREALR